ncbi:hypothetical protein RRG08_063011 [Elysia crispata]|uniref:Uncharacterized protein n=1 Tax=Elysia crispata TaxID=231223 RepID=A0AAE1E4C9_9GAST|nr:hypothetical protein RRG08_063011 [Elysia crispata]
MRITPDEKASPDSSDLWVLLLKLFHVSRQTRRVQIPQSLYLLKLFHVSRQDKASPDSSVSVLTETVSRITPDEASPDSLSLCTH